MNVSLTCDCLVWMCILALLMHESIHLIYLKVAPTLSDRPSALQAQQACFVLVAVSSVSMEQLPTSDLELLQRCPDLQADPVPQPSSFQPSNASFQEVARDRADLPAQAQTVSFTPSSQTFEEVTHQQLEQSPAEGSVPAHTDSARDSETEPQAAAPESSETVTSSEALPIDESSQPAAPGYADSARAAAPGYADSALDSLAGAAKGVAVGFGFSDGSANRVDDAHAATRQYLGLQPYEASSAGLQQLGSESPAPRREQDESARGAEDLPEATGMCSIVVKDPHCCSHVSSVHWKHTTGTSMNMSLDPCITCSLIPGIGPNQPLCA